MCFDCVKLLISHLSFDNIRNGGADDRLLVFFQELHALYGRIGSLIKLSRKEFYGKYSRTFCTREIFLIADINRRLCKDYFTCFLICLITDIFYIVPDQLPYVGYGLDVQIVLDFMLQIFRLNRKFRLFLHINASDCTHFYPPFV